MSLSDLITLPEFTCKLPSGKEIKYRPFVVKEEKILLMAKESKDLPQIFECIKKVIKNCVIEPKSFNPDSYAYFDIQQLFINLRCKSMGETVQIRVTDPETKQTFETELDLEKIKIINYQTKPPKVKLNNSIAIQYKYPTFSDFLKLSLSEKNNSIDALLEVASLCVDKIFTQSKVVNCSDISQKEITEFINNLPKKEFNTFCDFFRTMPKLHYKNDFLNPVTGKTFPVEVSDFSSFFTL